jgi:hypothetical protein
MREREMNPTPPDLREELQAGPFAYLAGPLEQGITDLGQLAREIGAAALDPNVLGGGGAAFLWEDLLSLEDVTAVAGESLKALDPETQVKLLLKMVLFWRKLRGVRVALGKEEYQVMKAVKQKSGTVAEIAARLGMPAEAVGPVVDVLKAKRYRDGIMLLEETGGIFSTQF